MPYMGFFNLHSFFSFTVFVFSLFSCSNLSNFTYEKTASTDEPAVGADAVLVCWAKPAENYKSLGYIRFLLNANQAEDESTFEKALIHMKKKAGTWGADAVYLTKAPKAPMYTKSGDLCIPSYILPQTDASTGELYHIIEGQAILLDSPVNHHASDDDDVETAPLIPELNEIY